MNDNKELVSRASVLLVRMCGVTPPPCLINPLLDAMFVAIQSSPVGSSVPRVTDTHMTVVLESSNESFATFTRFV